MSGFLKNFEKSVPASILSQAHRLLVAPKYFRFNPANLYYDPRQRINGLQLNHQFSCFALSSISQALTQESLYFQDNIQSDKTQELAAEIELNLVYAQECLLQAQNMVRQGRWAQETDSIASIIYATEHLRKIMANYPHLVEQVFDTESLYNDHLCPQIINNLSYLSNVNIMDITEGLVNAGYKNTDFWVTFLNHVQNCQFNYETVEYDGWDTNSYLYQDKSCLSVNHSQLKVSKATSTGPKSIFVLLQQAILEAQVMLWLPYVQREKRVQYLFQERNETNQLEFKKALDQLEQSIPSVKQQVQQILSKL